MTSSWKRPASSLLFLAAAAVAAVFGFPRGTEAAGCPTQPVADNGGTHWCYEHSTDKGHVHLWKPAGFNPDTAVTVIYIHGFNNDEISNEIRKQSGSYIDRAWDSHKLSQQFAASGINALFIAPEGPIGSTKTNSTAQGISNSRYTAYLWTSLPSLVTSVKDKGGIVPPNTFTVAGHSAGMYTALRLWADSRVKHVISLDWVDGSLEQSVAKWYNQGGGRMLTLVGGSGGQQKIMDRMQTDLTCTKAASTTNLSATDLTARCLYMRTSAGHMQVVTTGKYMPQALRRSTSVAATGGTAPTGPAPSGGGGTAGTITSAPLADGTIDAPLLEIPIPGLELSKAIRENGVITIPWLAQYAGGVYTFLLSIIGMVAAVMMVVGGFQYLTSGGDSTRLAAGRKRIIDALTGLILGLSSYIILYVINPNLVSFDGLKVGAVSTEFYKVDEDHDPGSDFLVAGESGDVASTGEPVEISDLGFADHAEPLCGKGCDHGDWCRQLGHSSTWPKTTPGYMTEDKTVEIADYKLSQAFPGTTPDRVLVAGRGQKAHPKVRDALYAAAKQATIDYPNNKYKISVSECWRSLVRQIVSACSGPAGAFTGVDPLVPSGIASAGASNHGVGYACDLKLFDGSRSMIPTENARVVNGKRDRATKSQCYAVEKEDSKRFDDIMFKVGWVRYEAEVWHYEFGSPTKNRCGPNAKHGGPKECVFPPAKFCK